MSGCGHSASEIFARGCPGYSLDDVIFLPGYIDFSLDAVTFLTALSPRVQLRTPLVSHPAVTGARMATAMALMGGLGVVGGCVESQVVAVTKVKRFENGFIHDPVTLPPTAKVSDVDQINTKYGFSTVPVVDAEHKLLGLVTARDIDFISDRHLTDLPQVMTPVDKLVTLTYPVALADANAKLREAKVGKLPIVDAEGKLVSLVSRNDLLKNKEYPLASKDANKQLLVGASVEVGNIPTDISDHVLKLVQAGVDLLFLEGPVTAQVEVVKAIRCAHPEISILASDVASIYELAALAEAGVHAITVTASRAQAVAIFQLADFARTRGVAVVGNPGVRNSGHIVKTLGLGADAVMVNRLFQSTTEERGNDGVRPTTKADDSGKGSVMKLVPYYMQGAKHGLQDRGARSRQELHGLLHSGQLRMAIRSGNAVKEGNVHDLVIFKN